MADCKEYFFPAAHRCTAIQLAHLSGFSPIITTANPNNTEWLKSLGATVVLNRSLSHDDLIEEVKKLTNGKLLHVYDAISSDETQKLGLDLLADGGKVAVVTPPVITSTDTKTVIHVFGSVRAPYNIALLEPLYHDHLYGLVEQGFIKVRFCSGPRELELVLTKRFTAEQRRGTAEWPCRDSSWVGETGEQPSIRAQACCPSSGDHLNGELSERQGEGTRGRIEREQ